MSADAGLRRRLGFGLLLFYGVGVMVGAGIYVLTGAVAQVAGQAAPWAFLIAGLVALPTALTYAELSSRLPESGGEAAYLREAFDVNWLPLLATAAIIGGATISAAAVLQGGVGYLSGLVDAPRPLLTVLVLGALAAAAIVGVLESLTLAAVFTVIEVGGLLLVIWAGFAAPPSPDWTAAAPVEGVSWSGVTAGALLAFFAFIGFEDMVNMAEETRDAPRVMPRAVLAALAITTLLYILTSWAAVRAVPMAELTAGERPLAQVAERGVPGAGRILSMVAVAAALNGVLAQIVMAARLLYGAGKRMSPLSVFAKAHPRFGTPVLATLVMSAAVLAVSLTVPLISLAVTSSSIILAAFVLVNLSLIRLKRRGPPPPGVFVAPAAAPWVGVFTALGALLLGAL